MTKRRLTRPLSRKAYPRRFPGLLLLLFRWAAPSTRLLRLRLHLRLRRTSAALRGQPGGVWGLWPGLAAAVLQCCWSVLRSLCTCGGGVQLAPSLQNTALTPSRSHLRLCVRLSCGRRALRRRKRLCATPKGKRWYVRPLSSTPLLAPALRRGRRGSRLTLARTSGAGD